MVTDTPPASALLANIQAQPANLARLAAHHLQDAGVAPLADAARCLAAAERIVLAGMGASLFAAAPAAHALLGAGAAAETTIAAELMHASQALGGRTAVVLISRSGESVEVARLLPILRARPGVTIIGLTNEADSQLAQQSHVALTLHSLTDQAIAIQTYSATLALLYWLAAAARGRSLAALQGEFASLPGALEQALPAWRAATRAWAAEASAIPVFYLLARGASLGSAHAGALLLHEVAKRPAVAMHAAQFRHGPAEAVAPGFHGLVFTSPDDEQSLNLALAADLLGLGGRVRHIGPRAGPSPLQAQHAWLTPPGLPLALSPLAEIVPLQLAALALAEARGLTPGLLVVTPQVTRADTGFLR